MSIHLYAEHLVNIRTLSIAASLDTETTKDTKAVLAPDGASLFLTHEGHTASIKLPVPVPSGHNKATFHLPSAPTKQLSFRIQLDEKFRDDSKNGEVNRVDGDIVPWTAVSLTSGIELCCKSCNAVLLARDKVRIWKDLPSENWAEMMDFWHCHRPDVPKDYDHKIPLKGYSAESRLAIQAGVGMVDTVDFVFAADDCTNLTNISSPNAISDDAILQCSRCKTIVGQIHSSSEGYKLRKMHVSLSAEIGQPSISHESEKWLSCHLLSSIDTQGVRKFRIQSTDPNNTSIRIWIFTPDINIASSKATNSKPMRAVKVFWTDAAPSQPGDEGKLNQQTLSEGEIELPIEEMEALRKTLVRSAALLPEGSRKFQEWNVALLARFTGADVQGRPVQLPFRNA
ncbi:hypothetical protein TI39_contig4214g00019 [Zymoseptoria brevis]|uniref:Ubiquitin-conjugating enzyme E2C-binding protein n=1 Tax=Zymoseptoria brevis TaxID=1047168 RepID=A0A0F4G9U2_9PEZI|nr:hypothetical protein TI39_contig4214g00019 [Zymoseptoria brevis]